MRKTERASEPALPAGIERADLEHPGWKATGKERQAREDRGHGYEEALSFELWHTTGFGWCIPTLLIARAGTRRPGGADRTYAARVEDGALVRIGFGPHVTARHTVYVREGRVGALRRFLDLQAAGAERANVVRDRISTRRAQGALLRRRAGLW